jgi:hypothetical protein
VIGRRVRPEQALDPVRSSACVNRVDFLRKTIRVDQQLSRVPGKGVARRRSENEDLLPHPSPTGDRFGSGRRPSRPVASSPGARPDLHKCERWADPGEPIWLRLEDGSNQGWPPQLGHTARPQALLRQSAHPLRGLGKGRSGPVGARLSPNDTRRVRTPLRRRGRPNPNGNRTTSSMPSAAPPRPDQAVGDD